MPDVSHEIDGHITRITIERPESRNALTATTAREIIGALEAASQQDARVVVLTGRGTSFCAGADLREYAVDDLGRSRNEALANGLDDVCRAIAAHNSPVVAFVNGPALGAGATLALACDLRYAVPNAVIGIPAAKLGIVLNYPNLRRLAYMAGPSLASEMLLAARILDSREGVEAGLFNGVIDGDDPASAFEKIVAAIADLAPLSVQSHKKGLRLLLSQGENDAEVEATINQLSAEAFASNDLQEGIAAFSARRRPIFSGS